MTLEEVIGEVVRGAVATSVRDAVNEALGDLMVPQREPEGLLTVPEAADYLKMSTDHVYDEIRRGVLPKVQFGKVVRVSREDLLAYVAAHRQNGRS